MWIFGYGSLMWDEWEAQFKCSRQELAILQGYKRTFNKASVKNWGSNECPCPTLNLQADAKASCKGMAFEFSNEIENDVLIYLKKREGKDFTLEAHLIHFGDGATTQAFVPIYQGKNLLQDIAVSRKSEMIRAAIGDKGTCMAYLQGISERLISLGIDDPSVTELLNAVSES